MDTIEHTIGLIAIAGQGKTGLLRQSPASRAVRVYRVLAIPFTRQVTLALGQGNICAGSVWDSL